MHATAAGEIQVAELDVFIGKEFLLTVPEYDCPPLQAHMEQFHASAKPRRSDQLFYQIMDGAVDTYAPTLDWFDEAFDRLEDALLEKPSPTMDLPPKLRQSA